MTSLKEDRHWRWALGSWHLTPFPVHCLSVVEGSLCQPPGMLSCHGELSPSEPGAPINFLPQAAFGQSVLLPHTTEYWNLHRESASKHIYGCLFLKLSWFEYGMSPIDSDWNLVSAWWCCLGREAYMRGSSLRKVVHGGPTLSSTAWSFCCSRSAP